MMTVLSFSIDGVYVVMNVLHHKQNHWSKIAYFLVLNQVGKGSTQVVQQAQTITKSYTNIHGLYSEDGSSAAESNDHPPERRPALGRKRAKFSLKPKPPPR